MSQSYDAAINQFTQHMAQRAQGAQRMYEEQKRKENETGGIGGFLTGALRAAPLLMIPGVGTGAAIAAMGGSGLAGAIQRKQESTPFSPSEFISPMLQYGMSKGVGGGGSTPPTDLNIGSGQLDAQNGSLAPGQTWKDRGMGY